MAYQFGASLGLLLRTGFRAMPIVAAATGVWAVTFLPGIWTSMTAWLVRGICIVLWVWDATLLFRAVGKRTALAAPLFLIVSIALWFYAIVPALCTVIAVEARGSRLEWFIVSSTVPELFWRFVGSEGELAVLRFSLIGIAVSAWVLPADSREQRGKELIGIEAALPPEQVAVGFGIIAAVIYVLRLYVPADHFGSIWAEWHRHIGFAALALFLASYASLAIRCTAHAGRPVKHLIFLSTAAIGPVLFGGLKAIVFIFGVAGWAIALARRSARFFVGAAVVTMIVLASVALVRHHTFTSLYGLGASVVHALSSKLVARQVESVDCLTGVIRAHSVDRGGLSNPFYFTAALVPSILWRDKPNLSQSGITVIRYCDPYFAPNIHTGHSASGTLLWEPLAFAGVPGLVVAQILTFMILIILSRIWINGGPYAATGVLALTPWTIDFDQHFALYVANLAKAGLVTGAFLFVLARVGRILRWQ
jgi:hypothetical protein